MLPLFSALVNLGSIKHRNIDTKTEPAPTNNKMETSSEMNLKKNEDTRAQASCGIVTNMFKEPKKIPFVRCADTPAVKTNGTVMVTLQGIP